ncbi:MAG: hypothetical protein AABZ09_02820, partial [Candidatus Binatota bacterium]
MSAILMWALVARVGDVLQLRTKHTETQNGSIKVLYTAGKRVMLTQQPYVVTSHLGPWGALV